MAINSGSGTGKNLNLDSSIDRSAATAKDQPVSETATSFETAVNFEPNELVDQSPAQQPNSAPQNRMPPPKDVQPKRRRQKKRSAGAGQKAGVVIQTELDPSLSDEENDGQIWETTYRGMPSWLSSLIIHLSIILVLAFLTINNQGKSVIDLLAGSEEVVALDPLETFQIAVDPVDMEDVSEKIETSETQMLETNELEPVLDDALLFSSLDSEMNNLADDLSDGNQSGASNATDSGGAKFFGVKGEGTDFVFVVDCSGSMADYGRWNRAVGELKRSIKKLNSKQKFLILLYNDGYIAMNRDAELVKSTDREQKRAFRWLGRKRPDSWTFCAEALAKAISLHPDAIFLLSDGEFDDRADVFFVLDSMNSREKLQAEEKRQIPIHTVALGSHDGRFTMKRIADENSGSFEMID